MADSSSSSSSSSAAGSLASFFGAIPKRPTETRVVELPWVEKYRPKSMADIAHQDEVTRTLTKSLETGNLPHLLFYGPPGTGKTSTILAIAQQLYGPEIMSRSILELNASDDRGIDVVREKVKNFAQTVASTTSTPGYKKKYPCPPYKLIILDEADSMTSDAQAALRRVIENYSKTTRFCLICNYVSRIIDPLASRCAKFRFKPLPKESLGNRLSFIAQSEGFTIAPEVITALDSVSGGDLRKAVTLLQSAYRLDGASISPETIEEVSGVVPLEDIQRVAEVCRTKSFEQMMKEVKRTISNGYNIVQFITQTTEHVIKSPQFTDAQKSKISFALATADACLVDGADEYIQLLNLCSVIHRAVQPTQ